MLSRGEAQWQPYFSQLPPSTPAYLRSWLLDRGSLTKRLVAASNGQFSVHVLQQAWARPSLSECQRLKLGPRELVLVREVHLYCDHIPMVYARTVVPRLTLQGKLKSLGQLGSKPLGAALFRDPSLARVFVDMGKFDSSQLPQPQRQPRLSDAEHSPETDPAKQPQALSGDAWGRRSLFTLKSKPLLVSEVFLSSIQTL